MSKKLLILLLTLIAGTVRAQCGHAYLRSAFFSLVPDISAAIRESAYGISSNASSDKLLYFYSSVSGSTTGIIQHQWMHNGQTLATIQLHAGMGEWQDWSAVPLTHASGNWEVVVLDANQCVIGRLSLMLTAPDPVLLKAEAELSNQDVVGAKLTLKTALSSSSASSAEKRRWRAFMNRELMLAEAADDLRQQQLVAAQGRLQALQGQLSGDLAKRYQLLLEQLTVAQKKADNRQITHLQAAFQILSSTFASCPSTSRQATATLSQLLPSDEIYLTGFEKTGGDLNLTFALPSGRSIQFAWPCRQLLPLP
jgi:hypothetical protein